MIRVRRLGGMIRMLGGKWWLDGKQQLRLGGKMNMLGEGQDVVQLLLGGRLDEELGEGLVGLEDEELEVVCEEC